MKVLVTGAAGFLGKNLVAALRPRKDVEVLEADVATAADALEAALGVADVVFHLAGVNRPENVAEFATGNAGVTEAVCAALERKGRRPKIVLSSSIQAERDNPYGQSKRGAEEALEHFSARTGAECVVHRLKNLFGKWCRPNYNSVTATFCHNIAHDLPIQISDPGAVVDLTYVDDVVAAFLSELDAPPRSGFRFAEPLVSHQVTLGELAETIRGFRAHRTTLRLPDFSSPFVRALYATYLSYVEPGEHGYQLDIKADTRGSLAEFLKSPCFGQIFISRTKPGITRGNHYHHTKTEKFLVVQGEGLIRLRQIDGPAVIEFRVRGEDYRVVDIPPGYTHSIENVGAGEMVTLFWSSEVFDPSRTDTIFDPVLPPAR
ncbi:polysaccharide biosynthesis C-terminal domain-containing protein [Anaeromyxobacter oryzae]|uniref:Capsular polysaccharide biosynthesis protein Cap8F n=1 Tax=Anaeromyxobacter oryzae TaxID=2918170 RepID=A0ABN6MUK7_9BACT|nr:NAD-dependent epimerase/dehydratase family protein [Anaeromyxobacter oryzae]BDG03438.1 capsular polysaccharide biosynthesis protein Cap8F [Anaeromyxobacter oryzae]